MKVIFLDIDGVLINGQSQSHAHPACVNALNVLTRQSGAVIVVSSTWRRAGLARIRMILRGWSVRGEVRSVTPSLAHQNQAGLWVSPPRGQEIRAWLQQSPTSVEHFVILDDERDMEELLPRLIQTRYEEGLTLADVGQALALLR